MPSELRRLILWDIDGTLLSGGSVAREVFDSAVAEVTGQDPGDHGVRMSGKTDPQIALEIMERAGVPEDLAREELPRVLQALEAGLDDGKARIRSEGRVHPGVLALLKGLHADPGVLQSVLTGNLRPNARVKVEAFGLELFLDLDVGAFGSDHHVRDELIPIALRRLEERRGESLDPRSVWVIGDTPADLACAKAGGARCLLVATGRYELDELIGLGADEVLPDLGETDLVLGLLLG